MLIRARFCDLATLVLAAAITAVVPLRAHASCWDTSPFSCPCDWIHQGVLVRGTVETLGEDREGTLAIAEVLHVPATASALLGRREIDESLDRLYPDPGVLLEGIRPGAVVGRRFVASACTVPDSEPLLERAIKRGLVPFSEEDGLAVGDEVIATYKRGTGDVGTTCKENHGCAVASGCFSKSGEARYACDLGCSQQTASLCAAHREEALGNGVMFWVKAAPAPNDDWTLDLGPRGTVALSSIIADLQSCTARYPVEELVPPPECNDVIPDDPGSSAGTAGAGRQGAGCNVTSGASRTHDAATLSAILATAAVLMRRRRRGRV